MSLAIATERFSDKKTKRTIDGNWGYQRGWDVVGYTDEDDAVTAYGIPSVGTAHPLNSNLFCVSVDVVENKLTLAHVVALYQITSLKASDPNPLNRPPIVRWRPGKKSEETDTDQNGNPILNAATDAFKRGVKRNFSVRYLTITRYEPYYDQGEATLYTDTTNDGAIGFEGNTFAAGQVYCISIAPAEEYQENPLYVKIQYDFEIRSPNSPNLTDLQIRYPHQARILNQGQRAVFTDPASGKDGLGHLYLQSGEPVHSDVLLDETGVPMDDTIKVTAGMLDAVPQTLPDTVFADITDTAVFLVYVIYPEVDFSGITD